MMEFTSHPSNVFRILLVSSIVALVILFGSTLSHGAALANSDEAPFYFVDEAGRVQQPNYWLPKTRSRSDFEIARRQYNEQLSQEVQNRNQAMIDSYYSARSIVPPAGSSFWITPTPGAQTRLCTEVGTQVICH